jgi:hypothetical protein
MEVCGYLNREFISLSKSENNASSDKEGQNSAMKITQMFVVKHAFIMITFHCI